MPPEEPTMALSAEGYTELPPGKIAAVVTFLEMREPPARPVRPAGPFGLTLIGDDIERYRALFRRIGAPWLWFSRLVMPEPELRAILADPAVEALALRAGDADIGLLELDFRHQGACEIAFLGVAPEAIGTGAGRFLIETRSSGPGRGRSSRMRIRIARSPAARRSSRAAARRRRSRASPRRTAASATTIRATSRARSRAIPRRSGSIRNTPIRIGGAPTSTWIGRPGTRPSPTTPRR